MTANSGYLKAPLFHGVRSGPHLNTWFCNELLVVTGHVLYMWYTPRHHVCVNFLMMSDFEIQRLAYCSCLLLQLLTTEVKCLPICEH